MKDFCRDVPDERNYRYKVMFGIQNEYPRKYIMDKWDYQNQGFENITRYMCVYYSTAHGNNEQNIIEKSTVRISAKQFWLKAHEQGLLDLEAGTLLQNWPEFAKTLKYISGYSWVKELEEIKDSLVNNRPIVVGTNRASWKSTKRTPFILKKWKSYWHAFVIIGYDDNYEWGCLICKNSYWEKWGDNGNFYIKYSDYRKILFYSKFSLIDEIDPILDYKKKVMEKINIPMAKVGFELWIWNGLWATKPMTREEVVTVVLRTVEKIEKGEISGKIIWELFWKIQ